MCKTLILAFKKKKLIDAWNSREKWQLVAVITLNPTKSVSYRSSMVRTPVTINVSNSCCLP